MSREGLSMRKAREILRLRLGIGLTARQVAESCQVSCSTVSNYEKRARAVGLSWPLPDDLDDTQLERIVRARQGDCRHDRPLPDAGLLVEEMRRPHVTLHLLWLEYKEAHPDGYGYTQFCHYYREAKKKLSVTLRQEHRAGEKLFTDYAGDTIKVTDPATGEKKPVYVFVATLGASNYTYTEATADMGLASWVGAHGRALEFFGGVPEIIVPDNTKCAVTRPDRYEPDLNPTFAEMAAHYGTAIIPARVRKPRDKAPVETGVLLVERWILAALRNRTFFSLAEANDAIGELIERLNNRKFKCIDATRRELFERLDRPALKPLPPTRYAFAEWRTAKVNIDYHVAVLKHFYSVPYQLAHEQVDVRVTSTTVEVFYKHRRVASHIRSYREGGATTNPEHMPNSHRRYLEWTPTRIINWARRTGPNTAAIVERILEMKPHPEMGFRSCLGIIRLGREYGPERLEAASEKAFRMNAFSYKSVKSILQNGLDRVPTKDNSRQLALPEHTNIRGRDYYRN
jgi:transposase